MIVFKVSPGEGFNPCVFKDIDTALEEVRNLLDYGEIEDEVTITSVEMTLEELENLPEHTGY